MSLSGASSCLVFASDGKFKELYPRDKLPCHIAISNVKPFPSAVAGEILAVDGALQHRVNFQLKIRNIPRSIEPITSLMNLECSTSELSYFSEIVQL